jgi:hypothetical protein
VQVSYIENSIIKHNSMITYHLRVGVQTWKENMSIQNNISLLVWTARSFFVASKRCIVHNLHIEIAICSTWSTNTNNMATTKLLQYSDMTWSWRTLLGLPDRIACHLKSWWGCLLVMLHILLQALSLVTWADSTLSGCLFCHWI